MAAEGMMPLLPGAAKRRLPLLTAAGFVGGAVGGFLFAPGRFDFGGMGSAAGPLVGSAILVLLPQVLTFLHDYEQVVLGLVIMGVMIFLRHGIVPSVTAVVARAR